MAAIATTETKAPTRPPRDNLVRAWRPGLEVRNDDTSGGEILKGHFVVFNRWTEIDSWFEGNFMERVAPGACKKTFREQRDSMRVLLQHGRDPQIGDKPIGSISTLREDEEGGYYEAPLFKGLPDLVVEGLRANQYGASFRFRVMREEYDKEPSVSDHNPKGIPERTIKEMQIFEFGPVTFPAYSEATAGLRSLTDAYLFASFAQADPEKFRALFEEAKSLGVSVPKGREAVDEAEEAGAAREDDTETQAGTDDEARTDDSPEEVEEEVAETRDEGTSEEDEKEEADAERDESLDKPDAAPEAISTPLNTTVPRSRRVNRWELPARRGRKTPRPPIF